VSVPELLPCPWSECGWSNDEKPMLHEGHYATAVICPCCGMRGPLAVYGEVHPNTLRERAAFQWNALPRKEED